MNDISSRRNVIGAMPPGVNLRPAGTARPAAEPGESFSAGQTAAAPWLRKPVLEQSKAVSPDAGQKKSVGTGKMVAIAIGGVAAGVAATAGIIAASTPAPAQPVNQVQQQSSRQEKKALENLNYLNDVARADGGGLKVDGTSLIDKMFHTQREASPSQAAQTLREGRSVYFFESEGEIPVTINSYDELTQVTRDLKDRVAETKLQQGIQNVGEGLKRIGEQIQEGVEDIFR